MNQCRKIEQQLLDQFGKMERLNDAGSAVSPDLTVSLARHLQQCESCRQYWQNLKSVANSLEDLGSWAESEISTPALSHFENLVTGAAPNKPVKSGQFIGREVSAFVSLGVLILTGAVLAVIYGYWLPVAIIFSLISMQAPLFILLRDPE